MATPVSEDDEMVSLDSIIVEEPQNTKPKARSSPPPSPPATLSASSSPSHPSVAALQRGKTTPRTAYEERDASTSTQLHKAKKVSPFVNPPMHLRYYRSLHYLIILITIHLSLDK